MGAVAGRVGAVEPFEDMRQMLCGDAFPGVGDGDLHCRPGWLGGHGDAPTGWGVPQRVGQQARQDLYEPVGVS